MPRTFPLLRSPITRDIGALVALALAVVAVYFPFSSTPTGARLLLGVDYQQLHIRRIAFIEENFFGPAGPLPAWYPREFLGMPFWSYGASLPFIPTRWLLLLVTDAAHLYTWAILLAAVLAAWFTYLYGRTIGLGVIGSAAAGWTFACAGCFAGRVLAGHLAVLEAYPALPLLAWLCEGLLQRGERGQSYAWRAGAIAVATASIALAGHPQIPIYAMASAGAYVLIRGGLRLLRPVMSVAASMLLGIGVAAFALYPMALLVARSTRTMGLLPAANDVAMPYGRLIAFFLPWWHGVPVLLKDLPGAKPFVAFPNEAYFWDTVCYLGWLPWVLLVIIPLTRFGRDQLRRRTWAFWLILGLGALALSLPWWQGFSSHAFGSGLLRSPVRLIYITTFALSLLLGLGIHTVRVQTRAAGALWPLATLALGVVLVAHGFDVGRHARAFVVPDDPPMALPAESTRELESLVGDGRMGIDAEVDIAINRQFDDVGFFDSIALARTYGFILSLHGKGANTPYTEMINGGTMFRRALLATGTRVLITREPRSDLTVLQPQGVPIYDVGAGSRRTEFFPMSRVAYLNRDEVHANLRDQWFDLSQLLMLPEEARLNVSKDPVPAEAAAAPQVEYERRSSDEAVVRVTTSEAGYLRLLEAFDPGWRATVNGGAAEIVPANDALIAIHLPPGVHEVRFTYHTVGARTGLFISMASLAALALFLVVVASPRWRGNGG